MAASLPLQEYREVLANAVEQGGLTLSPLGRYGFALPETRLTEDSAPATWEVVDLKLPHVPNKAAASCIFPTVNIT